MSYWLWDPALNLGINMLDAQHRHIVDFINLLHEAQISQDDILISETLIGLADYTVTHFTFEEKLLEFTGCPLLNKHKKTHDAFAARIDKYRKQHANGRDIAPLLMSELKLWLTHHINVDDRAFVPHIKNMKG